MKHFLRIFFLILVLFLAVISLSFLKTQKVFPASPVSVPENQEIVAVSAEELTEGFFLPVSVLEKGTAGSSLKEAGGAVKVLSFAVNTFPALSYSDQKEVSLQTALLVAWSSLTPEQQERFDENYPSLSSLLDNCLSDFSNLCGLFEDAGVLPEMQALLQNPDASSAWKLLSGAWENCRIAA
ncbi:MAG: hypothetical protein J6S50_10490 [Oscillospiraceae bacterium]|nr:hypothetical protein [Oscillospiraceae bacterium]